MAVTIQSPQIINHWLPSGNDINFTISSNQTTQSGFYFLVGVIVNDVTAVTLRKYPITSNSIVINCSEIVQSFITSDFYSNNIPGSSFFGNDWCKLNIVVTEWYNGESQGTATSDPIYIWDAAAQWHDAKNAHHYERIFSNVVESRARPMGYHLTLTASDIQQGESIVYISPSLFRKAYPMNRNLQRTARLFTHYGLSTDRPSMNYFVICGIDKKGTIIKKYGKATGITSDATDFLLTSVISGKVNANNFDYAYALDQFASNNMDDCPYIMCYWSTAVAGIGVKDYINCRPLLFKMCECDEAFAVLYKSYEGGWNIIQCNRRATETTDIKTITRVNANPLTWNNSSRLATAVNVTANGSITLHTDWVNDEINEDIKDMLLSPSLYIIHYNNIGTRYIPVTLSDATLATKQVNDVYLFNYNFNFIESFTKNTIKQ